MCISNGEKELLKTLVDKAKDTMDNYTSISVSESNRFELRSMAENLKNKGYITDVDYRGRRSMSCKVTEKGMNYHFD